MYKARLLMNDCNVTTSHEVVFHMVLADPDEVYPAVSKGCTRYPGPRLELGAQWGTAMNLETSSQPLSAGMWVFLLI